MADMQFVNFRPDLRHPKLSWFIGMLNKFGIAHRVGQTASGIMLQVQKGAVEMANEILQQELASFVATDPNNENCVPFPIQVIIDDLPNDHPYFMAQVVGADLDYGVVSDPPMPYFLAQSQKATESPELATPLPAEPWDDNDERPSSDDITEKIVAGMPTVDDPSVDEDEDDDLDWAIFFEDDDEEDESEDGLTDDAFDLKEGIIDIPVVVSDSPATDPEFKGETAPPAPPKERKKKEKAEPKAVADPDFDTGTTEGDLSAPVDGTEFLKIDEYLAFEDVQFSGVSAPVRMYDIDSSTISAMGAKVSPIEELVVTMYVRFKSGAVMAYRYNPVGRADWNTACNLAIRKKLGIQEASVGSFFHHAIRVKAEEGVIHCQRLTDDDKWVIVPPKSERTKQVKARD